MPVEIADNVVIGAGSVVTKNINEPGIYAGNPAKKIKIFKMKIPFVDLKRQYQSIENEVQLAINQVIENTNFIKGEDVDIFEKRFSELIDIIIVSGLLTELTH